MNRPATGSILQVIRGIIEDQRVKTLPDAELLRLFSDQRDEAAFRGLLRRHGGMVLVVCRNVLGNEAEAEDAFQATFLQLARKAGAIRNTAAVGSWLYGVAYRTALKTQANLARRARHERLKSSQTSPFVTDDPHWREVREIVLAELNGFSERYRAPLVLCYLEGKTQEEAALVLGIPKATLKKQLERARALLRVRLVRQGLGSAAVLAGAWPGGQVWAVVPPVLVSQTMKAAMTLAASQGAAALIWIKIAVFTERMINVMLLHKFTTTVVGTVALGTATLLGSMAMQTQSPSNRANAQVPGQTIPALQAPGANNQGELNANNAKKDLELLQGEWVKTDTKKSGRIRLIFNDGAGGLAGGINAPPGGIAPVPVRPVPPVGAQPRETKRLTIRWSPPGDKGGANMPGVVEVGVVQGGFGGVGKVGGGGGGGGPGAAPVPGGLPGGGGGGGGVGGIGGPGGGGFGGGGVIGPPAINSAAGRSTSVFYSIKEKEGKKILVLKTIPNQPEYDVPFRIEGDKLILDGGTFEVGGQGGRPSFMKVELKGEWRRVNIPLEKKLQKAFPGTDVDSLPIQMDLPSKRLLIAASTFTIEGDGRIRLEDCAIAWFGAKEETQPTTIRSAYTLITVENPVRSIMDLGNAKFLDLEFADGLRINLKEKGN